MGKYKKYIWMAGLCCALPLTVSGQQVEPLTGADRLFNEGRELFLRQDYAAARQTLVRYTRQAGEKAWADEVDYMLACTAYELKCRIVGKCCRIIWKHIRSRVTAIGCRH